MGGSTSKLKRWMTGSEEDIKECERAVKRLATPFVYTRRGSMYFDEDGDVAHEFYEEVPPFETRREGHHATDPYQPHASGRCKDAIPVHECGLPHRAVQRQLRQDAASSPSSPSPELLPCHTLHYAPWFSSCDTSPSHPLPCHALYYAQLFPWFSSCHTPTSHPLYVIPSTTPNSFLGSLHVICRLRSLSQVIHSTTPNSFLGSVHVIRQLRTLSQVIPSSTPTSFCSFHVIRHPYTSHFRLSTVSLGPVHVINNLLSWFPRTIGFLRSIL